MLVTWKREQNGGYRFDKFDIYELLCYYNAMWYVRSGEIQGVSNKKAWNEAFLELFDAYRTQTGHWPDLGVLGAASPEGLNFQAHNTIFFLTEWTLFEAGRIPRMSHEFTDKQEHLSSLFNGLPDLDQALKLSYSRQDAILEAIDIYDPEGWDDVIEVPDDYVWKDHADGDASLSGS